MEKQPSRREVLALLVKLVNISTHRINSGFAVLNKAVGVCSPAQIEEMVKQLLKETDYLMANTTNVSVLKYGSQFIESYAWPESDEKKTLEFIESARRQLTMVLEKLNINKN